MAPPPPLVCFSLTLLFALFVLLIISWCCRKCCRAKDSSEQDDEEEEFLVGRGRYVTAIDVQTGMPVLIGRLRVGGRELAGCADGIGCRNGYGRSRTATLYGAIVQEQPGAVPHQVTRTPPPSYADVCGWGERRWGNYRSLGPRTQ